LPPGGSCSVELEMNPTSKGKVTGSLQVMDNVIAEPQLVRLTGKGK
jgi:hypothetical protein